MCDQDVLEEYATGNEESKENLGCWMGHPHHSQIYIELTKVREMLFWGIPHSGK